MQEPRWFGRPILGDSHSVGACQGCSCGSVVFCADEAFTWLVFSSIDVNVGVNNRCGGLVFNSFHWSGCCDDVLFIHTRLSRISLTE